MTLIRVEPVLDERSGRYLLEIYHPHDAERPFVTTLPRYGTAAAAQTDLIATIAAAAGSVAEAGQTEILPMGHGRLSVPS